MFCDFNCCYLIKFCPTSTNCYSNYISQFFNLLLLNKLNQILKLMFYHGFSLFNKLGNDLGIMEKDNEYELIVCIVCSILLTG